MFHGNKRCESRDSHSDHRHDHCTYVTSNKSSWSVGNRHGDAARIAAHTTLIGGSGEPSDDNDDDGGDEDGMMHEI